MFDTLYHQMKGRVSCFPQVFETLGVRHCLEVCILGPELSLLLPLHPPSPPVERKYLGFREPSKSCLQTH